MKKNDKKRALALSHNIKRFRKTMRIKQWELAETLNVAPSTVSSWEQGISAPDLDTLFALSRFFNLSIEDLTAPPSSEEKNEKRPKSYNVYGEEINEEDYNEMMKFAYILDLSSVERKIIVKYRTGNELDRQLIERVCEIKKEDH